MSNLIAQITVYYHPAGGEVGKRSASGNDDYPVDFGHVFVEVMDLRTSENHYLDIWNVGGQAFVNRDLSDARRGAGESVTWRITEEQLDGAVGAIEARLASCHAYGVLEGSCVDSVRDVLSAAGYDVADRWFPADLWNEISTLADAAQTPLGASATAWDGGVAPGPQDDNDAAIIPAGARESNLSDGESRYVAPNLPGEAAEQRDAFTPDDANTTDASGRPVHVDFDPSGATDGGDGYDGNVEDIAFSPDDANMTDTSGQTVHADFVPSDTADAGEGYGSE